MIMPASGRIIVLGMHRSGTSCVSNLLTRLGAYFGPGSASIGSAKENPKGFWERRDIRNLCDGILFGCGCDWWNIADFSEDRVPGVVRAEAASRVADFLAEAEASQPWFIKEPRLSVVWPVLSAQVEDPVFIHVWRHPVEVAKSLRTRNGFPLDYGLALWEAYVCAATQATAGKRAILLSYNQLLLDPVAATKWLLQALEQAGVRGLRLPGKTDIFDAVDAALHRQKPDPELDELLFPSQRDLLEGLKNREPQRLMMGLSNASRVRLRDWARRESAVLGLKRDTGDNKTLQNQIALLRADLSGRNERLHDAVDRLDTLTREAEARALQLIAERGKTMSLKEQLRGREKAASGLRDTIAQLNLRTRELEQEAEQLAGSLAQSKSETANQNQRLRDAEACIDDLQRRLADRNTLIVALQADIVSLNRTTADKQGELNTQLEARASEANSQVARLEGELLNLQSDLTAHLKKIGDLMRAAVEADEKLRNSELSRAKAEKRLLKLTPTPFSKGFGEAPRLVSLLRYERALFFKLLAFGSKALPQVDERDGRFSLSLYLHYRLLKGRKDARHLVDIARSGFFHPSFYQRHASDSLAVGDDPLLHFMDHGAAELCDPSPLFHTKSYLERHPEVAASGINPLLHFVRKGRHNDCSSAAPAIKPPVGEEKQPATATPASTTPPRVVIYTALVGNYEKLTPVTFRPPGCDFVAFSDRAIEVEGWKILPINYIHSDAARSARFVKLHPHLYFPEYDFSLWVDANIRVRDNIADFIAAVSQDTYIGAFDHPYRNCAYDEVVTCIKRQKDAPAILQEQSARYAREGFPTGAGLWETGVLARRHNDPQCIRFMHEWWRELELGSRRDQVSLPVVRQRFNTTITTLGWPGADLRNDPRITFIPHDRNVALQDVKEVPKLPLRRSDLPTVSVDIGICVHNSPNETKQALASAKANLGPLDRIVIVDDASDPETASILDEFAGSHERVVLVRQKECRGYTRSANAVLREAKGDWVVLLNSDAILPSGALRKLISCGEQYSKLAVIDPMSNAASWQSVPVLENPGGGFCVNAIPVPLTIEDMDSFCEEMSTGVPLFTPLVNGFCFAIRRSVIDTVGLFDEETFPMGYGEEDDFCLRVADAGFVCGIATNTYVFHHKSASFQSERRKRLAKASGQALRLKHGAARVAQATQMLRDNPELVRARACISERQGYLLCQLSGQKRRLPADIKMSP